MRTLKYLMGLLLAVGCNANKASAPTPPAGAPNVADAYPNGYVPTRHWPGAYPPPSPTELIRYAYPPKSSLEMWRRTALAEGEVVTAKNPNGVIRVEWVSQDTRRFEWTINGVTGSETVQMTKRLHPWRGYTGLYTGGRSFVGRASFGAVDAELHVFSVSDLLTVLREMPSMEWTRTDDGLIVGFFARAGSIEVSLIRPFVAGEPLKDAIDLSLTRAGTPLPLGKE